MRVEFVECKKALKKKKMRAKVSFRNQHYATVCMCVYKKGNDPASVKPTG